MTYAITCFLKTMRLKGVRHNVSMSALRLYGWVKLLYPNNSSIGRVSYGFSLTRSLSKSIITIVGSTSINHKHFFLTHLSCLLYYDGSPLSISQDLSFNQQVTSITLSSINFIFHTCILLFNTHFASIYFSIKYIIAYTNIMSFQVYLSLRPLRVIPHPITSHHNNLIFRNIYIHKHTTTRDIIINTSHKYNTRHT